jgi:hypothetical protein
MRELGAGLVRVYLYWSQVEPEPGRFDWTVVDAFLDLRPQEVMRWPSESTGIPSHRHRCENCLRGTANRAGSSLERHLCGRYGLPEARNGVSKRRRRQRSSSSCDPSAIRSSRRASSTSTSRPPLLGDGQPSTC